MSDLTQPSFRKPRRRRRWLKIAGIVAAVLVVIVLIGPRLLVPVLRAKLQTMAREQLNAELQIGSMSYWPPYQITADEISFTQGSQADQRKLELRRLEIELARFPAKNEPLVIRRLILREPTITLVGSGATTQPAEPATEVPGTAPARKPSELFELQHFAVHNGQLRYIDPNRAGAPPIVWSNINVDMETVPQQASAAEYAYRVRVRDGGSANLDASGSMNIDDAVVRLQTFSLEAQCDPSAATTATHLPQQLQPIVRDYQLRGRLTIGGSGEVWLRDLARSRYTATLAVHDAGAVVPAWDVGVDRLTLKLACETVAPSGDAPGGVRLTLQEFVASSGPVDAVIEQATAQVEYGKQWQIAGLIGRVGRRDGAVPETSAGAGKVSLIDRLNLQGRVDFSAIASGTLGEGAAEPSARRYELLLFPRGLAFQPPAFPLALREIDTGQIRVADGLLEAANLSARYGEDELWLQSMRVPLADLSREVRFESFVAGAQLRQPGPAYPAPADELMAALRPAGTFNVEGDLSLFRDVSPPRKAYHFNLATDDGSFRLSEHELPVTDVRLRAELDPGRFTIDSLAARSANGTIQADGHIDLVEPHDYRAELSARNVDLRQLTEALAVKTDKPVTGRGSLKLKLDGSIPAEPGVSPLTAVEGDGELELIDSSLWEAPILDGVVGRVKVARESLTVGEAAAIFDIGDNAVHVKKAAVSAPALGLQAQGDIGFDGNLKLSIIAAPLADWKKNLKRTNVPVLRSIGANLAGAVQRTLDNATRDLFYDFRVTGTIDQPQYETVPAPLITEQGVSLFEQMVEKHRDTALIDFLRPRPSDESR